MPIDDFHEQRQVALRSYVIGQSLIDFEQRYPGFQLSEITALICAYEEEGNIAHVLSKLPTEVHGCRLSSVVVVDGGKDRTAEIARANPQVAVIEFPVNLGHGVALQVGYRFCVDRGSLYVVTLDADGQNDPGEIPVIVEPLLSGQSDFVVASRRLGVDTTSDDFRKWGVRFFSFVMNRMTGSRLTDTSNGFRAMKTSMLADVVDRLQQQQYQTAELLITSLKRGWRVSEVPTMWYERLSGETKKGKNWRYGFRYGRVVFGTWWRER